MATLKVNPYKNIDWQNTLKCRANLHTHTTESDGGIYGSDVIARYKAKGYKILFITDHDSYRVASATPSAQNHVLDLCSYPWSIWEGGDTLNYSTTWQYSPQGTVTQPPIGGYNLQDGVVTFSDGYKMLTGKASEYTRGHHINMYFGGDCGRSADENASIANIQASNGMAIINHPSYPTLKPLSFYKSLYESYPISVLHGIEILNGTTDGTHGSDDRLSDRALWDGLLTQLMPNRPIWGYSGDDMHGTIHLFKAYQYFLLPSLTEQALKTAMTTGASFMCYDKTGSDTTRADYGEARAPLINQIITTDTTISIIAENYTTINWVCGGVVVGTGETFNFENYNKNYVRAEIVSGTDLYTYTQPFGFDNYSNALIRTVAKSLVKVEGKWRVVNKMLRKMNGRFENLNVLIKK